MSQWDSITHLTELEKRCAALWLRVSPASVIGPITGLIVGEMPGRSTSGKLPLFPHPKNSSGGRLWAMSGVPIGIYLGRLARTNLLSEFREDWDRREAAERAKVLVEQQPNGRRVVVLGKRVGEAFGFRRFFEVLADEPRHVSYTCIPHPSARNLEYRDVAKRVGARIALQFAADYMVAPKENK